MQIFRDIVNGVVPNLSDGEDIPDRPDVKKRRMQFVSSMVFGMIQFLHL